MSCHNRASQQDVQDLALQALPLLFDYLPVDARLMAAAVCSSWRAALAPPGLWRRLIVEQTVPRAMRAAKVLAAASARAAGQLEFLDISNVATCIKDCDLLAALRVNAGSIKELRLGQSFTTCRGHRPCGRLGLSCMEPAKAMIAAAPGLRIIHALDMRCAVDARAPPLFSCAQLAGRLRLRRLALECGDASDGELVAALRDAAACEVEELCLDSARLGRVAADALADLAAASGTLRSVLLWNCELGADAAPALRRLPQELRSLSLCERRIGVEAAAALAQGVAASTSLQRLTLDHVELWADANVAEPLLRAAAGHPALRMLSVCENEARRRPGTVAPKAAGALLAAVLTAPGGALEELDLSECKLRDDGMAPLVAALPHAIALQRLRIAESGVSEEYASGPLARAVRGARKLRGDLSFRSTERNGLLRQAQSVLDKRGGAVMQDDAELADVLC